MKPRKKIGQIASETCTHAVEVEPGLAPGSISRSLLTFGLGWIVAWKRLGICYVPQ